MKNLSVFIGLCGLALLSSCASLYVPNSVNAPLLTEKNEVAITANTGMNGWDLQAAYSPVHHFGIMLNTSGSPVFSESQGYHGHKYLEGGLGFTTGYATAGVFEFYGGMGYGSGRTKSNYTSNGNTRSDKVEGEGFRYFVQPSVGIKKESFEFAFTLRGVYAEFVNVKYDNYSTLHERFGSYVEPVFTIRAGAGKIKFHSQAGFSLPVSSATTNIRYRPLIMNLGVIWRIGN